MHVAGGSLDWVPHRDEDVDLRSVTGLFPSKPSLPNGRRRTKSASSCLRSVHLGSGLTLIFSVSALMFLFYQRSALSADGRWVETGVSQRVVNESLNGLGGSGERNSEGSFLEAHTAALVEKGFLDGDAGTRGDESESESGGLADADTREDEFDGESGVTDQSDAEFSADQHMLFVDAGEEQRAAEAAQTLFGSSGQSGQVNGTVVAAKQDRVRGKQKSRSSRADRLTAEVAALDGNDKGKNAWEGSGRTDVMLVTGVEARPCTTQRGSEIALKGLKNKIDYAR
jgi:hypothetical protein